jgi:hypothetical protein
MNGADADKDDDFDIDHSFAEQEHSVPTLDLDEATDTDSPAKQSKLSRAQSELMNEVSQFVDSEDAAEYSACLS